MNGLIIQWGIEQANPQGSTYEYGNINFPIAFEKDSVTILNGVPYMSATSYCCTITGSYKTYFAYLRCYCAQFNWFSIGY